MARIELVDVSHAYIPGTYAVQDINLTWEDGTASALLGPSGCGKTTLLKIISGLLKPSEGRVLLDGRDVTDLSPQERDIAQVFQFPVVYETLNVYDNLAFPLRNRSVPEQQVRARVNEVADILNLRDVLRRNAASLGAAEQQRIAMGRGIVRFDTTAILFDEPLTVIDPHQKSLLRRSLKQLHERLGLTMVYVTHDQHEALTFAEQVTVMATGSALQTGTPSELHSRPQAPFVGYFIGSPGMNLFGAEPRADGLQVGELLLPVTAPELTGAGNGDVIQAGIRPEFVQLLPEAAPGSFEAEITTVTLTGSALLLSMKGAGLRFRIRTTGTESFEEGSSVHVLFPLPRVMVYVNERAVEVQEAA